ncbi:SusD/RagB family nutrient-binding outer membrane lipoprotein [Fodinibius sp. Rm-B-1B1-1]|uniref:SusD/RagB family nutrient-binding outer membrane lipoprotein n=1 Tax=Fodinibius alkaliphilus TaxID=3140241 RepID=UPI00315B29F8
MNTINKLTSLLLVAALTFVSCNDLTDGYDKDPNSPSDAPPELMLSGAQVGMMLFMEAEGARISGMWDGHFTGSDRQYVALNNYNVSATEFDGPWAQAYANTLGQTKVIRSKADELNNRIIKGIAGVVQAQTAGMAAALWGDIPYSQYGNVEEYPNPEYDSQAQVYESVQTLLDESIADLQSGQGINPGDDDVLYSGDLNKWIEAAYTLKARYYLHVGDYEAANTAAQNGISTPDNDMYAEHNSVYGGNMNAYFSFSVYDRPAYMSANEAVGPDMFFTRMDGKTDEIARAYYSYVYPDVLGDIYNTGTEINFVDGPIFGLAPYEGKYASDRDFPLVTYAENELIRAEALTMDGPQQDLDEGISVLNNVREYLRNGYYMGSWESVLGAPRQYDDYNRLDFEAGGMADVTGSGDVQANLFHEIIEERFFTLQGTYATFNDIRRTGNVLGIPANTGNEIPQRFLIPQTEVNANDNVPSDRGGLFDPTPVNSQSQAKALVSQFNYPEWTKEELQEIRAKHISQLREKLKGTSEYEKIKKAYQKVLDQE